MNENKTNEDAFPTVWDLRYDRHFGTATGMSLRDYFAAKALQGLAANPIKAGSLELLATRAFMLADLMLLERAK